MKTDQYDKIYEKNVLFVAKLYWLAKRETENAHIVVGITIDSEKQMKMK